MSSAQRVGGASGEVSICEVHPFVAARYARFTRTGHRPLLEHTKKNVVASGRRRTREIESTARSIIANR